MSNSSKIQIGQLIREEIESRGMKASHFAKLINKSRQNVHNIFGRQTIDTELLFEISKVLNIDFFALYSKALANDESSTLAASDQADYEVKKGEVHYHFHLSEGDLAPQKEAELAEKIEKVLSKKSDKK